MNAYGMYWLLVLFIVAVFGAMFSGEGELQLQETRMQTWELNQGMRLCAPYAVSYFAVYGTGFNSVICDNNMEYKLGDSEL